MKTNFFFIGALLMLVQACSHGQQDENEASESEDAALWANNINCQDDWNKFANEYLAICYPSDWNKDDSGTFGSELVLTSSIKEMMPNGRSLNQNINIMKQEQFPLKEIDINNLDDFAAYNKQQIELHIDDAQIFSFDKTTIAGVAAYRNVMRAVQNGSDLYFDQFMFYHKSHYWVITLTAPISASEESKALGEQIMRTLVLRTDL